MKKNKKGSIITGAGLGMIFGSAIWNAAIGLVLGAAIGLIIFSSNMEKSESSNQ